jgi:CBS domain-containing protein
VLIREVMTGVGRHGRPGADVREVAELMRERNVGSVVLVDGDRPVGFVTDRDLTLSVHRRRPRRRRPREPTTPPRR